MRPPACEAGLLGLTAFADACGESAESAESFPETLLGCPAAAGPCGAGDPGEIYAPIFRALAQRLAAEQARADRDRETALVRYDELMGVPPSARAAAIAAGERFASAALADRLLELSLEVRREDADASRELSRLALAVAERLDPGRYGAGLVADLKARSWAYLGEAWGEASPPAAHEAFRVARRHLLRGSGDPLEVAEHLTLAAGLQDEADGGDSALDDLARAEAIYRFTGERERLAETLARGAGIAGRHGDHRQAAELLEEAMGLLHGVARRERLAELAVERARHLELLEQTAEPPFGAWGAWPA